MTDVILGIGSNRTWKEMECIALLRKACALLEPIFSSFTVSSIYRTRPMYMENQDNFFNMVVRGKLPELCSPRWLLEKIHNIESSLGRDRTKEIRNGPRSIDIDIEFFGNIEIREKDLQIPHPRISERAFVLIPMLELLENSADFINREVFVQCLDRLEKNGPLGVEKVLSSQEFIGLKNRWQYGAAAGVAGGKI